METITINEINYIFADYILKNAPIYSKSCRSSKDLIRKREIKNYIFARYVDSQWKISDGKSAKFDKVLIKQEFIQTIDELNPNGKTIVDDNGIEKAPEILLLEDFEKFKDNDGNILNIETRGERKHDNIYFKVKDVSNSFNIVYLNDTITDKDGRYEYNIDYKYFICCNITSSSASKTRQKTCNKELFLTYEGILRVLFVSRNNKTTSFIKWATETLFTVHLGESENKEVLGTNILNINLKTFRAVFKSYASKFPCIYLLELGPVADLRETFNISTDIEDNLIIYKYGFTDDMERRLLEHTNDYGKLKNVNVIINTFQMIDIKYTSDAENDLRQFFKNFNKKLNVDGRKELVVLNNNELKTVKREYKLIGTDYAGATLDLQNKIRELENKINEQNNHILNMKAQYEIESLKKEMLIKELEAQVKYKNLELEIKEFKLKEK